MIHHVYLRIAVLVLAVSSHSGMTHAAGLAEDILDDSEVADGLVVHVGCGDGRLTAALHAGDGYVVQGLATNPADLAAARKHIQSLGVYGKVSVAPWTGERLPYVDNLVNLVVTDDLGKLPMNEVMRVLAPNGVAWIDGNKTVKPWPKEIDQWPQHHHGADNNAVARDSVVGPPRRFQWVNDPVWSRSHLGMASITSLISANGRLFSIEDRGSVENPALPGKFFLICRDAFNGIELWRHRFPDWHPVNIFIKLTPSQLQRQLVAVDDKVYCTPSLNAPITVFDATTGRILNKYDGTEMAQEFVYDKGLLFAVVGDPVDTSSVGGGRFTLGETGFPAEVYGPVIKHLDDPKCAIAAIEADSGRELWKEAGEATRGYQGASLAVRGSNVVYSTLDSVACLERASGEERWRTALKNVAPMTGSGRNGDRYLKPNARRNSVTLVVSDEAVYLGAGNSLTAFAIEDGTELWSVQTRMNHHKPPDIFLTGGAVWTANNKAYDPLTGEPIKVLSQRVTGPMGHDRCYQNRITDRWYINTASGGSDFLALDGTGEFPHPWGRSTCGIGHLPCNGLLYLGPPACSCANKVQLNMFNALAPEPRLKSSGQPLDIPIDPRLEEGPAYAAAAEQTPPLTDADWPTYRRDSSRSGHTTATVTARLKPRWQTKLTTRASAPVIVADQVFVADVDAHAVCALNADNGKVQWTFTADGRVDSPPTWHQGRLLPGSHGGWVYCLRAKDGSLMWRFKALPDRLICANEQIESAWPVCGSILVEDSIAYLVAGRNSFVDGGLLLFGLDPETGRVIHQRNVYGPYDDSGHPIVSEVTALGGTGAGGVEGNKGDVLSSRGEHVFLRHQAFKKNLDTPRPDERVLPHLITSHGFVEKTPHHRSFWTIDTELYYDRWTSQLGVRGDILVMDGKRYYEVRGYPPGRYTTYDVREHAYTLFAGELSSEKPQKAAQREYRELWQTRIPLTGKAMALAGDVVFVAGTPAVFPEGDLAKAYEGRMGGVLWAASAADGREMMEYTLDAAPEWDSLAAANGRLFLCTTDGKVHCFAREIDN
ncbi:MAG: outer membrane protein assembly factor BamB family protein [Planctomycetota bacterium]|jgi:outer membrane protein assembly factor BamB